MVVIVIVIVIVIAMVPRNQNADQNQNMKRRNRYFGNFLFRFRLISNCKWGSTLWHYHCDNTTHKYTSHIHNTHITYTQLHLSHKITPPKTKKNHFS
jgi:hypothetical protein